jgi:hypothetical protein
MIRILLNFNYKLNSIVKLYLIRDKILNENNNINNFNSKEYLLILFYFLGENKLLENYKIYSLFMIIFCINNHLINNQFFDYVGFLDYLNWPIWNNLFFLEIKKNIKFSKIYFSYLKKDLKGKLITNSLIAFAKCNSSISLFNIKKIFMIDFVDIQYWIHELNQDKKICAKIDKLKGMIYFY